MSEKTMPYVVSADLSGLMRRWGRTKGLNLPDDNFFIEATEKLKDELSVIFDDVTVIPESQLRSGLEKMVRTARQPVLSLAKSMPDGALVLTRMRDDNIGIVKIAEKLDYVRTGIRVASSQVPGIFHEYWHKMINPNK